MMLSKMSIHCASPRQCCNDRRIPPSLAEELAQHLRDHPAECRDLLWLPLFSRNARREGVDGTGDCFFEADADFAVAPSCRYLLDRAQFLGLPFGRVSRDVSTRASAR